MTETYLKIFKKLDDNFTILYIEDDEDLSIITYSILKKVFNHVILARDGEDGLSKFKSNKINLILTDINMPKMNGLDMLTEIRKINSFIPVIIFSSYSNKEYLLKSIQIGIDDYIIKPYREYDILEVLSRNIKKYLYITNNKNPKDIIKLNEKYYYDCFHRKLMDSKEKVINIGKKEDDLLKLLIEHKNNITTYSEIEDYLYKDEIASSQTIRALISRLKKRFNQDIIIQTIRGLGVKLIIEKD